MDTALGNMSYPPIGYCKGTQMDTAHCKLLRKPKIGERLRAPMLGLHRSLVLGLHCKVLR